MKFFVLISLCVGLSHAWSSTLSGSSWQYQTAEDKQSTIENLVTAQEYSNSWPSTLSLAGLFTEDLDTSFTWVGDDMPAQGLFDSERKKLIHSVGAIAEVQWKNLGGHPYTGVFTGDQVGYLRWSAAKEPTETNITPGLSLKLLRDNVPSANIFAMYSLQGTDDFGSFFTKDFTNHVPDLNPSNITFEVSELYKAFAKVSDTPTCLGLSDLALYDESGDYVSNPQFPFRLIFHPSCTVYGTLPSDYSYYESFVDLISYAVSEGDTVYEVYAQSDPYDDSPTHIADLVLTSDAAPSLYGDQSLFFQHTFMEADLDYHPEWKDPLDDILAQQREVPYYRFANLPFDC